MTDTTVNALFRGERDCVGQIILHCPECDLGIIGYKAVVSHVNRVHRTNVLDRIESDLSDLSRELDKMLETVVSIRKGLSGTNPLGPHASGHSAFMAQNGLFADYEEDSTYSDTHDEKGRCYHNGLFAQSGDLDATQTCGICFANVPNRDL